MGPLGDTLAQFEGQPINVFGGIQGEEVVATIIRYRRRRKRMVSGLVREVLTPSPHRVAPPCPYFGPCTGCQWQHVEYGHQLTLKQRAVEAQLKPFPSLSDVVVPPTIACESRLHYRNHARFTVRKGQLGYVNRITRRFVRVDACMLMTPWINRTLDLLQDQCRETTQLSMRYGVNTGEWLIQPTLRSTEVPLATGQTHFSEQLLGHTFRVASPSFFQVNTEQTERLAEMVRDRLRLSGGEVVVDAYARRGHLRRPLRRKLAEGDCHRGVDGGGARRRHQHPGPGKRRPSGEEDGGGAGHPRRGAGRRHTGPAPGGMPPGGTGSPRPTRAREGRIRLLRSGDPGQGP